METKQDKTIWLRNSADFLSGLVSAHASELGKKGWINVNCQPLSLSLELTPEQMRALAAELLVAAEQMEPAEQTAAA